MVRPPTRSRTCSVALAVWRNERARPGSPGAGPCAAGSHRHETTPRSGSATSRKGPRTATDRGEAGTASDRAAMLTTTMKIPRRAIFLTIRRERTLKSSSVDDHLPRARFWSLSDQAHTLCGSLFPRLARARISPRGGSKLATPSGRWLPALGSSSVAIEGLSGA